ncbi:hypothetical protein ACH3XW_37420 [Acanthocheilonema viteae]|uniref:SEA domain-containing protein n=1 Tax=Acanthocheilonema viteae TaxID=6277 RepID=A0A498S9S4_ACAVI|nr:unnamed protein product [Acanthocheilonema viteae]
MFGLAGKFQRRCESDLEQESNLTADLKNDFRKSKHGITVGYENDSKWSPNWSDNKANVSSGHPVTFEATSSSRKWLLCTLIIVSSLFLLFIIAIITAYAMNVIIIKFPSSSSSKTVRPYPFETTTSLPNFTTQPFFPPFFPTPLPPYNPIITTLPNPTDRLQKRTFLCQMYLLNKANDAYVNHDSFEYRKASQMIQNAIHSQLKQSPLQPHLENVYVWYLFNSGPHLAVEFSIILLLPSHPNIGLTSVKNVLLSILPEIEEQLDGTHIDRNSISIQYLHN